MHRRVSHAVSALLLATLAHDAQAQSPVLSTSTDPRAVAMGSAGVATGGGVLVSDANPSLLGLATTGRLEALGPVQKGFHEDSRLWQIGALWPSPQGRSYLPAVGIAYREYDFASEILVRTAFEPEAAPVVLNNKTKVASLILAMPFLQRASIGGAVRHADMEGITGWYADLGAVVEGQLHANDQLRIVGTFGVAARRLGKDLQRVTTTDASGPGVFATVRSVAASVDAEMAWGGTVGVEVDDFSLTAALELVDPLERGTGGDLDEHAGIEFAYRHWVALRAGVINDENFDSESTYGAGVQVPVASRFVLGLDYAREPPLPLFGAIATHAPDASHFVAVRVEYDPR